jgi:hypothetical protein
MSAIRMCAILQLSDCTVSCGGVLLLQEHERFVVCTVGRRKLMKMPKSVFTENIKAVYVILKKYQQARKVFCTICCYGTPEFITIITTAHHRTLSSACSTQFPASQPISQRSFLRPHPIYAFVS